MGRVDRNFPEYPHITEVASTFRGPVENEEGDVEFMNMNAGDIRPVYIDAKLTVGQRQITKMVPSSSIRRT